jgi:hypothetical protein
MCSETSGEVSDVMAGGSAEIAVEASGDFPDVLPEESEDIAAHLDEAGRDIRDTVGKTGARSAKLGANIAGQAQLSASGSDTFDAEALEGVRTVVDKEWAEGVAAHEEFHTQQKAPDAANVTLEDGQTVTAHEFIEAGAIAAQEKVAPVSVQRLSTEYKAIRQKFARILPSDRLLERSKQGRLKDLAQESLQTSA